MGHHRGQNDHQQSNESHHSTTHARDHYQQDYFQAACAPEEIFPLESQIESQGYEGYQLPGTRSTNRNTHGTAFAGSNNYNTSVHINDPIHPNSMSASQYSTAYTNSIGSHAYGTTQPQQGAFDDNNRIQDYNSSQDYVRSFVDRNTSLGQIHPSAGQYPGYNYATMGQSWSTTPDNGPQALYTNAYILNQIGAKNVYPTSQMYQHTPGGCSQSPPGNIQTGAMNHPSEPWSNSSRLTPQAFAPAAPAYPSGPMSPPSSDVSPEMMARTASLNFLAIPGHQPTYRSEITLTCECGATFLGRHHKNNKSNYKRHLNSLETAAYKCEHCESGFTREDNLQAHISRKHA